MTRVAHIVVASALLLVIGSVPAFASQACKPVVGHFEAVTVLPGDGHCPTFPTERFCTAGRVWGGIQGNYQFVITGATPAATIGGAPTVLFFTGRSTIFLKSGDQLLGADTGALDLTPADAGGFASLITFDRGTGAMTGATGQIRLRGLLSTGDPETPADDTTSGDYIGTLCTP